MEDLEQLTRQLGRIELKLDALLALVRVQEVDWTSAGAASGFQPDQHSPPRGASAPTKAADLGDRKTFEAMLGMSMKQHATLQMLIRGAGNQEIADRFGVSVNTAKVYLRSIAKRLGVRLRTQIALKVLPVLSQMDDTTYREIARGLPKNWDETYRYERREDDPFWHSYTGSRVRAGGAPADDSEL